jgi:hypothetical protein
MEVHHHPHTERKKWTHYFWEFFMLFLAVTLGFFVENQREHIIENRRAKEYAQLLLEDLKNDSIYIDQLLSGQIMMLQQADSLLTLLSSDQFMNNNYRIVYHFNKLSMLIDFNPAFPVNFEQVKNSGSLRYFKNKKLVSSMSVLNREMETIKEVYLGYNEFIRQYLTPFAINHLNTLQFDIFSRRVLVADPVIYDWGKQEAILLANKINLKKTYDVFFINRFLKECSKKIGKLAFSIKKEYHLK